MNGPNIPGGPLNMYYDEKQFHDEDESMAEYGNGENVKFNEDGSFIGLYGRDRIQTYVVQYNQGVNSNNQKTASAQNNNNNTNVDNNNSPNTTNVTGVDDNGKPYSTFV
jgi:hypothetical protein